MPSFVVLCRTSPRLKEAYLKAIADAEAGGEFILPEDVSLSRDEHNQFLENLKGEGKLFCAGPYGDFEGAMLVLEVGSSDEAENIMKVEPHFINGFITDYEIKEWHHRF